MLPVRLPRIGPRIGHGIPSLATKGAKAPKTAPMNGGTSHHIDRPGSVERIARRDRHRTPSLFRRLTAKSLPCPRILAQPFYRAGDATAIVGMVRSTGYSRVPVIGPGIDDVLGVSRSQRPGSNDERTLGTGHECRSRGYPARRERAAAPSRWKGSS